ncbi:Aldehyde/histidinol dehydrogenase [Mucidula mucida]|nr:Aldehyde/histidinol dehydrogenase [Mucidula mucida]
MPSTFTKKFETPHFNATINLNTGLFINGQFVDAALSTTGEKITSVAAETKEAVDLAVKAAQQNMPGIQTFWGLKVPGSQRGTSSHKLADLLERNSEQIAALESLNFGMSLVVHATISTLRYYAGWADKIYGKTIETNELKLAYTKHEPFGVVGAIVPWNECTQMTLAWKLGPALTTGNTIVVKSSKLTPLTAFKIAELVNKTGFPPGVVNIVNGYGHTAGQAISEHPHIMKLAFTESTATGRRIQEASRKHGRISSPLRSSWAERVRISSSTMPQVSQAQMDVSAQSHAGGVRLCDVGYFVASTIMTGNNKTKAFGEEIFGPVAAVIKFKTEEDTDYGLAAAEFTENSARAIRVSHALEAGSLFVNNYNTVEANVPFGGYKMSGVGRKLGEYALNL